jgi:hypothetical protein
MAPRPSHPVLEALESQRRVSLTPRSVTPPKTSAAEPWLAPPRSTGRPAPGANVHQVLQVRSVTWPTLVAVAGAFLVTVIVLSYLYFA